MASVIGLGNGTATGGVTKTIVGITPTSGRQTGARALPVIGQGALM
jgi:hypothetical protein